MAGNREIIEVLHFVGASDAFIAREFQSHFRRLGLRGAIIGELAGERLQREAILRASACGEIQAVDV